MIFNLKRSIKLALRLVLQSFFQPSTTYDFLGKYEKNKYIYMRSFFFVGLTVGILVAIPHYFIYKEVMQSIFLVFTTSAPFVVAGLVAFRSAVESKNESAFEGAFAEAGGVVFVFATVFAVAVASKIPGAFSAAAAVAGAVAVAVAVAAPRANAYLYSFTFIGLIMIILYSLGGKIEKIAIYEIIIYPLTFLTGYLLVSSFEFQKDSRNFKENLKDKLITEIDIPRLRFAKAQKLSLLWAPLFAFLIGVIIYFQWKQEIHIKILIAASFAILPAFILRLPDYLICLPIWVYQRRKILGSPQNEKAIMQVYNNSLLFKHEMIYWQLPALHKIMAVFAGNKEIGLNEALKQIDRLNRFTFQQKQARKSIITLGRYNITAHQYIHFLLENKNLPRVKIISRKSPLAKLYLMLYEKNNNKADISDVIQRVSMEMKKAKDYRFNEEMVNTLEAVHQFLTADNLEDFYQGCEGLEKVRDYPVEINYFTHLQQVNSHLGKIKIDLDKIETIELFETKRSYLSKQKQAFNGLLKTTKEIFYEPFQSIWQRVLQHCTELMEKEIKRLQESAVLEVRLKNKEIFTSNEKQFLYLNIRNKGRGDASNLSIISKAVSTKITIGSETEKEIPMIDAGSEKEITLPIKAPSPVETTIKGELNFSDKTFENKKIPFSFSINVLKRSTRFKKIKNPYVVGGPLTGETPLFMGREDAFQYIDENITTQGGRHTIVCHGLRRTGKTSLLNRIATQGLSDKRLVPIFFDIQGIEDEKHFYSKLSRVINIKLSLPLVRGIKSFNLFEQYLEKIKPKLGDRIILLMMDEFEELQHRVEDKKISRSIFGYIRHLLQHEKKLAFLFCGSHKLEEMSADYWSIFFNTAIYYRISHLNPEDARRLIVEPVQGQLTYDDLALEQILKMTNGQPHLTQLICHTIVNDLNETKKRNDALVDDVDDAVEKVISIGTESFSQNIWDNSTPLEQLILSATAEELSIKQLDRVGVDGIFNMIQALTDRFDRKEALKSLGKLDTMEILQEAENGYYFPVNLLRKWIALRFPLRKLREEI